MRPSIILRSQSQIELACKYIRAIKPDEKNPQAVYVGPYKKIRSLEQNALYWKLVSMVADATGHSREVLHIFFRRRAFGVQMERVGDVVVEYVPSSAKASKGDFSELIEHVQAFIAEHGIEEQIG
jgi:hypothetical protein